VTGLAPGSPSHACARARGAQAPGAARRAAALAVAPDGSQGLAQSSLLAPDATRRIPGATDIPHAVRAAWRAVAGSTALQTTAPGTTQGFAGTRTTDRPVAQQQRAAGMALPGARAVGHVGPHAASTLPGQGAAGSVGMPHGVCASWVGCAEAAVALRCGGPFLTLPTLAEAAGDSRRAPLERAALPMVPLPPAGFSYGYRGWKRGVHRGPPRSRRPVLPTFHPPVTRRSAR